LKRNHNLLAIAHVDTRYATESRCGGCICRRSRSRCRFNSGRRACEVGECDAQLQEPCGVNIEIYGAHYMTAEQVLGASHITMRSSVFVDSEAWRASLLRHPLVATATVQRRLPNTAVVRITETHPVAFARTPELRAIDAKGRLLPADPTAVDMDLPIIATDARVDAHGQVLDSATLKSVAVLNRLQELEPVLAPWVSEATPLRDGVRLVLRGPANAEVLLPFDVDAARLRQLRVTLADLAGSPAAVASAAVAAVPTDTTATPGLGRVTRIDVRYREQVVVSLQSIGNR
jgi:cell division protein FtsQ